MDNRRAPPTGPFINRLPDLLEHLLLYHHKGRSRFARDAGISEVALSRFINSTSNPRFGVLMRIVRTLEEKSGRSIHPEDVVAEYGRFRTPFCCSVMGCAGCVPESAWDEHKNLKEAFKTIKPGQWVSSRYPSGYQP